MIGLVMSTLDQGTQLYRTKMNSQKYGCIGRYVWDDNDDNDDHDDDDDRDIVMFPARIIYSFWYH